MNLQPERHRGRMAFTPALPYGGPCFKYRNKTCCPDGGFPSLFLPDTGLVPGSIHESCLIRLFQFIIQ